MLTTFDRYLLRRYLYVFGILFVSTYGLFVVIDGFTNVDAFQEQSGDAGDVLAAMAAYYAFQSALFFDMVGAILAVISVMVVFALLQKHSEILPILAAGVPTFRLLLPVIVGTMLVNACLVANQEFVIPAVADHLQAGRGETGDDAQKVQPIYDHETHIQIGGRQLFLADRRMAPATFVLPVPGIVADFTTLKAREAVYLQATRERPSGWLLRDVVPRLDELSLTPAGQVVVRPGDAPDEAFVSSGVSFDQLYNRNRSHKYVSTVELVRRMKNPAFGNASIKGQELNLHLRLVMPLGNLLSVLVAVPLIVRRESRGLVTSMALCAGVLSTIYVASQLFLYLGRVNLISSDLAAWAPAILAGTLGAWLSGQAQT